MASRNLTLLSVFSVLLAGAVLAAAAVSLPSNASANNGKDKNIESGTTISISNSGAVLVRGAEVENISGDVVTARTSWGDTDISWRVETDNDTDVLTKSGRNSSFSDISVGDEISFSGSLDTNGGEFAVDASVLKNWSEDDEDDRKAKAWGVFKKFGERFSNSFSFWHK